MDKYGFVYIWFDKYRRKFYIGCHWGFEDDGYICSSRTMRKAYRRRKDDFKRRVIQRVYTNRQDLLEEEHKWLSLILDDQLGRKYYNLSKKHFGHWSTNPDIRDVTISKMAKKVISEEHRRKISEAGKKRKPSEETKRKTSEALKGRKQTEEHKRKARDSRSYTKGNVSPFKGKNHSEESKKKLSESKKGSTSPMKGKQHSEESKKKMSDVAKGRSMSEEQKRKISESMKAFKATKK
jgi:hypothetical protein